MFKRILFGIYCLISLFVFSIAPFCHEQYGSAKYTGTPKNLVMSLCAANSGPLSVVMVFRLSLYGSSSFLTTFARGFACFPNGSFRISGILVDFSTSVSMACWSGSTIKSVSKSPNLFPSTSLLLSWMLTLSLIERCPHLGTMPVFHLMPCVLGKFPCCVIADDVIDGLVGHLYPLILAQITRYLSWRSLVIGDIFLDSPDQFVGEFGVRYRPLSAPHGHIVRLCPNILSRWRAVASDFT